MFNIFKKKIQPTVIETITEAEVTTYKKTVIFDCGGGLCEQIYDGDRGDIILNTLDIRDGNYDIFSAFVTLSDVHRISNILIPNHSEASNLLASVFKYCLLNIQKDD